jgi:hypothetical protein
MVPAVASRAASRTKNINQPDRVDFSRSVIMTLSMAVSLAVISM